MRLGAHASSRRVCRAIISSSLVGIDHAETRRPGALMQRAARSVRGGIKLDAQPGRVAAHAFADGGRVLADAAREHERIQPAERGGERAQLAPDAIAIEVDREPGPRIARGQERAHVARNAGHAEQARLVVEQLLDGARVHSALVHEVEQHAGVDRAAARAHRQPVEGGETHRARDARAGLERAHARAVAEVADDGLARSPRARRASAAPRRCTRTTARGSRSAGRRRQCSSAGSANVCANVGIACGGMRYRSTRPAASSRRALEQAPDRRQVVRLVQRRERNQFFELRHHARVDPNRRCVVERRRAPRGGRRQPADSGPRRSPQASPRGGRLRRRGRAGSPAPSVSRSPSGQPNPSR